MSEEMIDRVARAIGEKIAPALQPGGEPVRVKDVARAVIEAMREPTDSMVKASEEYDLRDGKADGRTHWFAMIDTALKD